MERTLVLIKPDAVERNLIGKIISCYEENGLKVEALRMEQISKEFAGVHYEIHKGKPFYNKLIEYITRSPLCAMVLSGENAVDRVRKINGATNPDEANKDTIRGKYGKNTTENAVHASDSKENAEKEIVIWL